ncbi:MAG: cyclic pyranopterin monophosphate synthase MoaC [Tissierellia bacterium]|nr:cyclic pyranopterin monophosphate synthase MoaC [Tissierellia bacterium]
MDLTHFNESGRAHMVNVGEKEDTKREAIAYSRIRMQKATLDRIKKGGIKKGDVLSVAQVAGIMAAKRTSDLIPMCHNIFLTGADFEFQLEEDCIHIKATVSTTGKTGVEMEALTAVNIAALTIYDMCKAIDKGMVIEETMLLKKTGGKSGEFKR